MSSIAFRPLYVPGVDPMPDVMVHASATEPMDMEPAESSTKMELEPKVESSLLADDDLEMELNRTLNEQMSDDKPESSRMIDEPDAEGENEGDNDSLFGGENDVLGEQQDIIADGDADGEADIENVANAFGETDADAETDSDGGVGTSNGYGRADPKTAQPQRSAEHDTPPCRRNAVHRLPRQQNALEVPFYCQEGR